MVGAAALVILFLFFGPRPLPLPAASFWKGDGRRNVPVCAWERGEKRAVSCRGGM